MCIRDSYYNAHKIALSSVNATHAPREQYPLYYALVKKLSSEAQIPMPKLYIMNSDQINAFASGRDPHHAVICVTTGSFKKLNKEELEGVLAHEISHILNYDIRYMTFVTVMVGIIAIFSEFFLRSLWFGGNKRENNALFFVLAIIAAILAPLIVQLVQLAISRKREFGADASALKLTKSSKGLSSALSKIKNDSFKTFKAPKALSPLFISDPLKRKLAGLFSTHPPIDERIKILALAF